MEAERPKYIDQDVEEQATRLTSELQETRRNYEAARDALLSAEQKAAVFLVANGVSPISSSENKAIADLRSKFRGVVEITRELPV